MTPVLGAIVGWELVVIGALVVVLFGSSQLPRLARSLGRMPKEFRKGHSENGDPGDASR
jgi:TatA/E family protein of Tat protein translocase